MVLVERPQNIYFPIFLMWANVNTFCREIGDSQFIATIGQSHSSLQLKVLKPKNITTYFFTTFNVVVLPLVRSTNEEGLHLSFLVPTDEMFVGNNSSAGQDAGATFITSSFDAQTLHATVWCDLRTTHLLLRKMHVQRQSHHQGPEALVSERHKYSEPINHLINHTTG